MVPLPPQTDAERSTEFQRRRNFADCEVRRMFTARSITTVLSVCGHELGSSTAILKRGKTVTTHYVLPSLNAYNAWLALPVANTT